MRQDPWVSPHRRSLGMESLIQWQSLNLRNRALVQQQLPSDPASTEHESIPYVGFHPRGDVNWNTCERKASK